MSVIIPMTYLFTGDTTNAILECDEILSVAAHPNLGAFLIRGWAHLLRGEYENAVHDFSRGIDKMEASDGLEALLGVAYRLRAICYEHQAEWNLALSDLKAALYFYEAEADVDTDDLAELRSQHSRVKQKKTGESNPIDVPPESAAPLRRPHRHEVLNAIGDGDLEKALDLCQGHLDDINIRFLRGLAKDFRGRRSWSENKPSAETDFEDAISEYSDVIKDTTSHFLTRAYVRRAQLQISLQQPEDALTGLDELNERHLLNEDEPLNIHATVSRGIAELRLYQFNAAGAAFDDVLLLDPKNLLALDGNGQVDLYTENRADALQHFTTALAIAQDRQEKANIAHFMFMIALTYNLDEQYEQAIPALEAIQPLLGDLQDSERRQLHQKMDILRQFLPAPVPDSEEAFEAQREVFMDSTEKEVKCKALLLCILYEVYHRTRSHPYAAK